MPKLTKVQQAVKDVMDTLRNAEWAGGYLYDHKKDEETDLYAYAEEDICKTFLEIEHKYNI